MIGNEVQSYTINQKAAFAAVDIRNAFLKVEVIYEWLALHPKVDGQEDPLTSLGFTEDEISLLRQYFGEMNNIRLENKATFDLGRRLTGLE